MKVRVWKRNIVVATVLLFVCAAVYLNWKYASNISDVATAGTDGQKVLGQSTLVSGEGDVTDEDTGAVETDAAAEGDYFATARLTRQQARDSAISLLREAAETIQVLAGYALAEAQIENLVTAKGYTDCVAFMGEDSISVVVSDPDGLEAADVARITDIVLTETDYTTDQITILEAN